MGLRQNRDFKDFRINVVVLKLTFFNWISYQSKNVIEKMYDTKCGKFQCGNSPHLSYQKKLYFFILLKRFFIRPKSVRHQVIKLPMSAMVK